MTSHIIKSSNPDDLRPEDALVRVMFGHNGDIPLRHYDDGGIGEACLWVYRESLGPVGVVRASSWGDAYEIVLDCIMDDAEAGDPDNYASFYDDNAEPDDLAEGVHYRPNGVPTDNGLSSCLAAEDLNGSSLELLTPELAEDLRIVLHIERDDD